MATKNKVCATPMAAANLFAEIFKPERDARVAVMFEQRDITYSELRTLTLKTAEKLNALDVRGGDRVAILLNDSPECIASFVAVVSLGAIAVPINMALRKSEQLIILKDCGARVVVVENQAAPSLFGEEKVTDLKLLVVRRDGETDLSVSNIPVTRFDVAEQQPLADDFSQSTTPGA